MRPPRQPRPIPPPPRRSFTQAAEALSKAADKDKRPLSPGVRSRIEQAKEATKEAAQKVADQAAAKKKVAEQAQANAQEALERPLAEATAAANDTPRKQLGVKIGELARAAEALAPPPPNRASPPPRKPPSKRTDSTS